MAKVFDVGVVLTQDAKDEEVQHLFECLEAEKINCVTLDTKGKTGRAHELRFAIYADMGQCIASMITTQCVQNIFHTDMVAVKQRR
jgi:hypothetical protein